MVPDGGCFGFGCIQRPDGDVRNANAAAFGSTCWRRHGSGIYRNRQKQRFSFGEYDWNVNGKTFRMTLFRASGMEGGLRGRGGGEGAQPIWKPPGRETNQKHWERIGWNDRKLDRDVLNGLGVSKRCLRWSPRDICETDPAVSLKNGRQSRIHSKRATTFWKSRKRDLAIGSLNSRITSTRNSTRAPQDPESLSDNQNRVFQLQEAEIRIKVQLDSKGT